MRTAVAVIQPYWSFWEDSVPHDLRAEREDWLRRAVGVLGAHHDVVVARTLDAQADALAVAEACRPADAVVVLCTMAAPALLVGDVLAALPAHPVVVWAADGGAGANGGAAVSHSDITTRGATVGAPMVVGALAAVGRRVDVVWSSLGGAAGRAHDRIGDSTGAAVAAVGAAAAAGRLRRSRLLRVGDALPGYEHLALSGEVLATLGLATVDVPIESLVSGMAALPEPEVSAVVADVLSQSDPADGPDPAPSRASLAAAARVELALAALVSEHAAAGGALNCHGDRLRGRPGVGVAPCLALGRLTSRGVPWTCTGDAATAVAKLVVDLLGHPGLYHEIQLIDPGRDEVLLANSGEHDLRLCPPGTRPRLVRDPWFTGDPVPAACLEYALAAGPASLVALAPGPPPVFVVARGGVTGRHRPGTGTPHATFRFAAGPAGQAWARWAATGVPHHAVVAPGDLAGAVARVAGHLGVGSVTV